MPMPVKRFTIGIMPAMTAFMNIQIGILVWGTDHHVVTIAVAAGLSPGGDVGLPMSVVQLSGSGPCFFTLPLRQ